VPSGFLYRHPVPQAPLFFLALGRPKTSQVALGVVPSGWGHDRLPRQRRFPQMHG